MSFSCRDDGAKIEDEGSVVSSVVDGGFHTSRQAIPHIQFEAIIPKVYGGSSPNI